MVEASGYLSWDSEFFNRRIAFIDGLHANDKQIKSEINRFFTQGTECIYLFIPHSIELNEYDAVLADRKRVYLLDTPIEKLDDNIQCQIRPNYNGDASELYNLALQSGEHSRFRVDTHFSYEDFSRLYKKWIDNSVNGDFADYIFVVLDPGPKGFISAKIKGDRIVIGLFATDRQYRGLGIGSRLMQEVINEAARKGLKVEVVTQANNLQACRFYENKGFKMVDEQYVYHIWNNAQKD